MGLITEDPRPRIADSILSSAELVRPQSRPGAGTTVASGHQSVALQKRSLVYRSMQAGHKVVNVIPLRSIDSFCIRTFQMRPVLAMAIVLLLISAATGLWWYAVPAARTGLFPNGETPVNTDALYVTSAFLAAAMILLFVYLVFRRTELVVTLSGKNSIQLPLSRRIAASAEAFVAEVEAQIEGATG
ncbi:MAG: hypothetical protein ACRD2L_07325 [Terriglobia bacterium]